MSGNEAGAGCCHVARAICTSQAWKVRADRQGGCIWIDMYIIVYTIYIFIRYVLLICIHIYNICIWTWKHETSAVYDCDWLCKSSAAFLMSPLKVANLIWCETRTDQDWSTGRCFQDVVGYTKDKTSASAYRPSSRCFADQNAAQAGKQVQAGDFACRATVEPPRCWTVSSSLF